MDGGGGQTDETAPPPADLPPQPPATWRGQMAEHTARLAGRLPPRHEMAVELVVEGLIQVFHHTDIGRALRLVKLLAKLRRARQRRKES